MDWPPTDYSLVAGNCSFNYMFRSTSLFSHDFCFDYSFIIVARAIVILYVLNMLSF